MSQSLPRQWSSPSLLHWTLIFSDFTVLTFNDSCWACDTVLCTYPVSPCLILTNTLQEDSIILPQRRKLSWEGLNDSLKAIWILSSRVRISLPLELVTLTFITLFHKLHSSWGNYAMWPTPCILISYQPCSIVNNRPGLRIHLPSVSIWTPVGKSFTSLSLIPHQNNVSQEVYTSWIPGRIKWENACKWHGTVSEAY